VTGPTTDQAFKVGWLVFNGTFSTNRLYQYNTSPTLDKDLTYKV